MLISAKSLKMVNLTSSLILHVINELVLEEHPGYSFNSIPEDDTVALISAFFGTYRYLIMFETLKPDRYLDLKLMVIILVVVLEYGVRFSTNWTWLAHSQSS